MDPKSFLQFNLNNIDSRVLLSPENFEAIKFQAYRFIDNRDLDGALKYASLLETKLSEYEIKGSKDGQNTINILNYWVCRLKLFGFSSLSSKEIAELIKSKTIFMLNSGLDLRETFYNFLIYFKSDDIIKDFSQSYLKALIVNKELLGDENSAFRKQNFIPTTENWIKEFQSSLHSSANKSNIEPGTFDILKFLDSNQFAKQLDAEHKEVLKSLLALYDWLLLPIAYTQPQEETQSPTYMQSQKFQIPEGVAKRGSPPVTPQSPNAKIAQIMEEIRKPQGAKSAQPKEKAFGNEFDDQTLEKLKQVYAPSKKADMSNVRPVNIQDLLKSKDRETDGHAPGLRIGDMPFGAMGQAGVKNQIMEKKPSAPDIDKKLEELKKKIKP